MGALGVCLNKLRFDKEEKSEENSARVKLYEFHFPLVSYLEQPVYLICSKIKHLHTEC